MKKRTITLLLALFLLSAPSVLATDPPVTPPTQAADGIILIGQTDGVIWPWFTDGVIITWFINGIILPW
jgi:hypothetical protein